VLKGLSDCLLWKNTGDFCRLLADLKLKIYFLLSFSHGVIGIVMSLFTALMLARDPFNLARLIIDGDVISIICRFLSFFLTTDALASF
jgi:hypothetical protein